MGLWTLDRAGQGPGARHYLTFAEITEIEELIIPLCEDAQRVFNEGHYDQESADGGKVARERKNRVLVHASNPLF